MDDKTKTLEQIPAHLAAIKSDKTKYDQPEKNTEMTYPDKKGKLNNAKNISKY